MSRILRSLVPIFVSVLTLAFVCITVTPTVASATTGSYVFTQLQTQQPAGTPQWLEWHVTAINDAPSPVGLQATLYIDGVGDFSYNLTVDTNGNINAFAPGAVGSHTYAVTLGNFSSDPVTFQLSKINTATWSAPPMMSSNGDGTYTLSWFASTACCGNPATTGTYTLLQDGTIVIGTYPVGPAGSVVVPASDVTSPHYITMDYSGDSNHNATHSLPAVVGASVPVNVTWPASLTPGADGNTAIKLTLDAGTLTKYLVSQWPSVGFQVDGSYLPDPPIVANADGTASIIFSAPTYQVAGTHSFTFTQSQWGLFEAVSTSKQFTVVDPSHYAITETSTDPGPQPLTSANPIQFHVTPLNGAPDPAGQKAYFFEFANNPLGSDNYTQVPGYAIVDANDNFEFWPSGSASSPDRYYVQVDNSLSQIVKRTLTRGTPEIHVSLQSASDGNYTLLWSNASGCSECTAPTGVVTIVQDGTTTIGAGAASAFGSMKLTPSQVTNHYVQVEFAQDPNYLSYATAPLSASPFVPVSLTWSPGSLQTVNGQPSLTVKLNAGSLTSVLPGFVELYADGTPAYEVPVAISSDGSATATFTGTGPDPTGDPFAPALPIQSGTHEYTAKYNESLFQSDTAFADSSSDPLTVTYGSSTTTTTTSTTTSTTSTTTSTTTTTVPPTTTTTVPPTTTTTVPVGTTTTSTTVPPTTTTTIPPNTSTYRVATNSGNVSLHGNGANLVGLSGSLNKPIVGGALTPSGRGYWLVASDGGIFSFGDAHYFGSMGGQHLNQPIVGMATTSTGNGYWLVASDGGIFSFGDAIFHGSMGGQHLNAPIVGMAPTTTGGGYWFVAADGGIFSFGDAHFAGSMGGQQLNKPIVGMAANPTGHGYWFVASDGGIFSFGGATFYGSTGSIKLNEPIVGMKASADGAGYWFVAADGGIFSYGDAKFSGSDAGAGGFAGPVVAIL